jgi:AcrR family transcriptional regulator
LSIQKLKVYFLARTLTEEQIAAKRKELIEVAVRILEEEGFQALTLRRLATEAGISRTTPYLYFEDKADLLQKICVETYRYLYDECKAAMDQQSGILDKLTVMGRTYMKFGEEKPTLYRLSFAPENPEDYVAPEVLEAAERFRMMAYQPMEEAYNQGLFLIPPDRLNPVLWVCMHGLLSMRWAGHLSEEGAYDRVKVDMENILAIGFLNKDALPPKEA